jgi:hypothetical protein
LACGIRCNFGQAEIENLGVAALGGKDIGGFDGAMDDAFRTRRLQCVGDFDGQRHGCVDLHRPPGDAMLQRQPVQKFRGDEGTPAIFTNFVDGANVGMIQG